MVVIDCSALIEVARESRNGNAVRSLIASGEKVIAPDLLCAELASVYRKLASMREIDSRQALGFMCASLELVDELVPADSLCQEALSESIRLNHSSYDLFYLALARRTGATLVSLDRKLNELCEANGVECLHEVEF